jgi:hypothetical protein
MYNQFYFLKFGASLEAQYWISAVLKSLNRPIYLLTGSAFIYCCPSEETQCPKVLFRTPWT